MGLRSNTTGKRIEIDSVHNRIDIFNASNVNVVRIDDTMFGTLAGVRVYHPTDSNISSLLTALGVYIYGVNGTADISLASVYGAASVKFVNLPYASSGVPSGLVSGQLWRDGNNTVKIKP